jgi:DNA-binding transcriptional MerR regulator
MAAGSGQAGGAVAMADMIPIEPDFNASAHGAERAGCQGGSMQPTDTGELVPIDKVARRFGLAASALRYYERRGLLEPASRHAGRRWYGQAELRRLASIEFWQQSAIMSLDQITALLDAPSAAGQWKQIVNERRQALDEQIQQMTVTRDFLELMLTCPREHSIDDCPYFEQAIWLSHEQRLAAAKLHREHHAMRGEPEPATSGAP